MHRREALLTLYREKRTPGYIPFSTYGVDRFSHPWMADDPSYADVLAHTDRYDHIQALYLSYYASFGLTDILVVEDPAQVETETERRGNMVVTRHTLHTPKGGLTAEYKEIDGNKSTWRETPLVKTDEDINRLLSMPFVPARPDRTIYDHLKASLGDRGIVQVQVPNPVCLVIENMDYADFMMRSLTMPDTIEALLEWAQDLIMRWLEGVLESDIGESFRIFGAEYCQPPQMRLSYYQRAVTHFDKPIVRMIQDAGKFVQYHCHGPIRALLDDFLELGVDAIDPCESSQVVTGDITLDEIAERVGNTLVIMGNIQLDDIERAEPEAIHRLIGEAIDAIGDRTPFLLMPTAPPFETPLPPHTARNLIQFIDSARQHGGSAALFD